MRSQSFLASITVLFLVAAAPLLRAQHSHLNAGVYDTNNNGIADAGDELGFKNADDWVYDFVTNSGYVHQATTTTVGNIAAYYGGTAYTFGMTPTALSGNSGRRATIGTGGAVTYAPWEPFGVTSNGNLAVGGAATGSFLQLEVVSVELLSGSATSFSFWGPTSAYPSSAGTTPTLEWTFSGPGVGTLLTSDAKIDLSAINTRIGNGVDSTFPGTAPACPSAYDALQTGEGYRWNVDYNGGLYNLANSHFSGGFVLLLVLSGLALGAVLSDRWWHLFRWNFALALAAALLTGCFAFAVQSGLFWATFGGLCYQPYQIGSLKYFLQAVGPGLLCVVVPFTFAGLIFPLLLKHVEDSASLPLGWIFAFNGLGGWFGAELAQGILLPRFGLWGAVCLVAAGYAVSISILPLRSIWRLVASGGALVFCVGAWAAFAGLPQVQPGSAQRIRAVGIGREGVVAVAEGEPDDWRIIFNNSYTLGGSRAATNQERQALLPILLHGEAWHVATLGVATGSTASGALLHPDVESLDAIELSPLVAKFADGILAHSIAICSQIHASGRCMLMPVGRCCADREPTT